MKRSGVLYWITGLAGSGKTTIGNRVYYKLKQVQDNVVLLDGDILKTIVDSKTEYSISARKERAYKYAKLCKTLTDQGLTVICCTIAMFEEVRTWNRKNNKGYVEVFLDVPLDVLIERDKKGLYSKYKKGSSFEVAGLDVDVEFPANPDILLCNDGTKTIEECANIVVEHPIVYQRAFDRDTQYWNDFYEKRFKETAPSLFAEYILHYLDSGKKLLDLGCGNGRDSAYFIENGLNVMGIDASEQAIRQLQTKFKEYENSSFVCDDFVSSSTIYAEQYDYCYSRFSLHAINIMQEEIMLKNVFGALKEGGLLFIEVRSVKDDLYGKGSCVGTDEYIYEGHYRRFMRLEDLAGRIRAVGFEIVNAVEDKDFAPYLGHNPYIIRVIAKKSKEI